MYWVNVMIEVYKYGGTVLKEEKNRIKIYENIKDKISKGIKIFMVVSAFGRDKDSFSTDNLSKNIELLDNRDKDQIMTFGEVYSSLIIKNELLRERINAVSVTYDEIGVVCDNNYQDGNILGVDMSYLKELINSYEVVVIPGFIAQSMEGKIISLGRNTSDLTALIVGDYFKLNKVNIIKEVDGVCKKDPKIEKNKNLIKYLSYEEMISLIKAGSKMFAMKTLEYAKDKEIVMDIKGLEQTEGTIISNKESKEKILFVNYSDKYIKAVFKGMQVFNDIFSDLVKEKIKLEELVICNNIVYIKGSNDIVKQILDKYL